MKERGTAAIELAMAMIIMLMLAIGAYEWGTGFADRIAMTSAVREAGRVGSAAGRLPDADCRIIEAASAALNAVAGNPVKALWIYHSDTDGTVGGSRQEYRPADQDEPGQDEQQREAHSRTPPRLCDLTDDRIRRESEGVRPRLPSHGVSHRRPRWLRGELSGGGQPGPHSVTVV